MDAVGISWLWDAELNVHLGEESACCTLNSVAVSGWSALSCLCLMYFYMIEKHHFSDL